MKNYLKYLSDKHLDSFCIFIVYMSILILIPIILLITLKGQCNVIVAISIIFIGVLGGSIYNKIMYNKYIKEYNNESSKEM